MMVRPLAIIELDADLTLRSLAALFSLMDYAVFEFVDADMRQLNAPPEWLVHLAFDRSNQMLMECLPFLESFMPEAIAFWEEMEDGRIESDFWTQTDIYGEQVHLLAYALSFSRRRFLLVRSAEELYRERELWQVYAHETAMQLRTIKNLQQDMAESASALSALNAKLSELSVRDSLTGVYNRRHFEHMFDLELRRTYRSGEPLSMLLMDVDHFKAVNDTFGHVAGDECLRSICRVLQEFLQRPGDLIARIGGEEFAILLPSIGDRAALKIASVINQIVRDLKIFCSTSDTPLNVTVSIGVYTRLPKGEETMPEILQFVDDALYKAKRAGRDQVVVGSRFGLS
jgi:diguanylate cyclase (GGDEF)-like protein